MGLWSRVFGLSNKPKQDGPIAPPARRAQQQPVRGAQSDQRSASAMASAVVGPLPPGVWVLAPDPSARNPTTTGQLAVVYLDGPKEPEFVVDLNQADSVARSRVVNEKVYVAAIMVENTDGDACCLGGYTRATVVRDGSNMGFENIFRKTPPAPPPPKSFDEIFRDFVAGKEHGFVMTNAAGVLGATVVPELKQRLESDLHGPQGRAAVIAFGKIDPELALPLIEQAFGSSYNATRFYAAEYLANHPTEAAKQLARQRLEVERHETARNMLTRCVSAP